MLLKMNDPTPKLVITEQQQKGHPLSLLIPSLNSSLAHVFLFKLFYIQEAEETGFSQSVTILHTIISAC